MSITTNLIRQVLGDGARSTKYDVIFQFSNPATYTKTSHAAVLVKTASFPSISHTPVNLMYKGRTIPIRGQTKYANTWECTFYMPENHDLRKAFETWMVALDERIYFGESAQASEYKTRRQHNTNGYTVDITLYQLNIDEDRQMARYVLHNAFPIEIQAVPFQSEAPSQIEELSVTFSYSYFESTIANKTGNVLTDSLDVLAQDLTQQLGIGAGAEYVSNISNEVLTLASTNNLDEKLQKMVNGYNPDYNLTSFVSSSVKDVTTGVKDILINAANSILS